MLSNRTGEFDFAKTESEQLGILEWKHEWEKKMIRGGAMEVDTDKPLDDVVIDILRLTSLE